jgi:nucleotide-binding universal stress UspA family protein
MMKTIIVPTDFSSTAVNACDYAIGLAKETGARLILFHVFHVPVPATEMPVMIVTPEEMEDESRRRLEKAVNSIRRREPGVHVDIETRAGFPVEEITKLSKEVNADLIVMGMHEMGMIDELFIGSTTTDVIDKTHCPVLVIPGNVTFNKPEVIAFASDYKEVPGQTLGILKELAHVFHARVDVLNVVKPDETLSVDKAVAGLHLEHHLEDVEHTHHFPVNNNVQEGIKSYVEQFTPSMLAMVHRKHNFLERLFGEGNTQKAAFHTHIPLLAMRA